MQIQHLGCWEDKGNSVSARAISGGNRLPPTSKYKDPSKDLVGDCYRYAKEQGWTVFAAQNQNECYTSADAHETYNRYKRVSRCENDKGGFNAMDVFRITCVGKLK